MRINREWGSRCRLLFYTHPKGAIFCRLHLKCPNWERLFSGFDDVPACVSLKDMFKVPVLNSFSNLYKRDLTSYLFFS